MGVPIPADVGPIITALRRKTTYTGYAREALSFANCVLRYPLGVVDGGVRAGAASGDASRDVPVLLVHGFGHNRSGWYLLEQRLRRAGFTSIHAWNYDPWRHGVADLAERLGDRVDMIRGVTGAERVNVVGHSLGGILLRWYVQELGGDASVANAITVASPHHGTRLAAFGPRRSGRAATDLAPDSWLVRRLEGGARPSPVRWLAFYSNLDLFVQPASSAMITDAALGATNVFVKDVGHLSIMLSARVADGIIDALAASPELSAAS